MPGGYHSSTKPGSAQLDVPTRILPAMTRKIGRAAEAARPISPPSLRELPCRNPLAQERQHALRRAVRLSEHARAGLLQDLQLGEVDHLLGHVHVADTGLRGGQV